MASESIFKTYHLEKSFFDEVFVSSEQARETHEDIVHFFKNISLEQFQHLSSEVKTIVFLSGNYF